MGPDFIEFTTVGIDVGGQRKGFHAVALVKGNRLARVQASTPNAIVDFCGSVGAQAIAVDAPCSWSSGSSRLAERELARLNISSFSTPTEAFAAERPFYEWMRNGLALYECLRAMGYPLLDSAGSSSRPVCFETFPQAIACSLAGAIVSAKRKASIRRGILTAQGIDTAKLTNIDWVDAALCALTAKYFLLGRSRRYGDAAEGYIVVPKDGFVAQTEFARESQPMSF